MHYPVFNDSLFILQFKFIASFVCLNGPHFFFNQAFLSVSSRRLVVMSQEHLMKQPLSVALSAGDRKLRKYLLCSTLKSILRCTENISAPWPIFEILQVEVIELHMLVKASLASKQSSLCTCMTNVWFWWYVLLDLKFLFNLCFILFFSLSWSLSPPSSLWPTS